jgi:hypothetical protein
MLDGWLHFKVPNMLNVGIHDVEQTRSKLRIACLHFLSLIAYKKRRCHKNSAILFETKVIDVTL